MGLHSRRKHSIDRLGSDRAATNYDYVAGKVHEKKLTRRNKLRNALAAVGFTATAVAANLLGNGSAANAAPDWDRLASCESTGDWGINTGNGFSGGLQFSPSTWDAYRQGQFAESPENSSREDQIVVAERVLADQGTGAWPDCSSRVVPGWWEGGGAEVPAPAPAPEAPIPAPMPEVVPFVNLTACEKLVPSPELVESQGFSASHNGIDCAVPIGTEVHAVKSGTVLDAGPAEGYGQWVHTQNDDGTMSDYGHISSYSVGNGERIEAGEVIAFSGNEGQSTGPHLHYRDTAGDPDVVLSTVPAPAIVNNDPGIVPNIPQMNPEVAPEIPTWVPEEVVPYVEPYIAPEVEAAPAPIPQNEWVAPEADAWIPDEIEPYIPQEYVPVEPVAPAPETFQEPVTPEPWTPPVEEAPAPVVETAPVPEWVPPQAATDFQTLQAQIEQDFNNAQQNFNNMLQGLPR
jgi:hypothetical protein